MDSPNHVSITVFRDYFVLLTAENNIDVRLVHAKEPGAIFERINSWDGAYKIEVWKYPPIIADEGFVDRLSLALTLKNDEDPRVHKEVERIIEETW